MKISYFAKLFWLSIAIVLIVVVSADWSPHILKGNELLARGACCTGGKECEDDSCPPTCTAKNDSTCSKTASSTKGCWQTVDEKACGTYKKTGKKCGGNSCAGCTP